MPARKDSSAGLAAGFAFCFFRSMIGKSYSPNRLKPRANMMSVRVMIVAGFWKSWPQTIPVRAIRTDKKVKYSNMPRAKNRLWVRKVFICPA